MPNSTIITHVLLVDDQPANLLAMEAALDSLGVNLVRAMSGPQALAALEKQDFAAVLLDVRMPGMDGFEVAREIRSRPRSRFTPILFVTAGDDPDEAMLSAYALGAVDFLAKPLRTEVLKAKVAVFVELWRSKEELRLRERRDFEQRLEAKEERYRALFESIDEGFCVVKLLRGADGVVYDFRFEEANEAFSMHTGLADPVGRTICEMVPAFSHPRSFEVYDRVARQGEATRFVQESKPMNRWFDIYASRLGAPGGDLVAILFSDITQRLLAEQDLRRLNEELAQANRRKTEFLATLAHELRNPLAPLSNGLHLMRMASTKPELLEKTRQMMERQIQHMVHLVDDLLDVARISTGKVELRRQRVDLRDVVATAVETSASLIESGKHKLTVEVPSHPLPIDADPTRIAQVVSNLLNNAAKYTPEGGRIALDVRVDGEEAVLAVTDTGIGIAPDALGKVFEMFAQVPGAGKPQGGLGIGLSLVQSLVALHGGNVSAASAGAGAGSTFTVRLPLAPALPVREDPNQAEPQSKPAQLHVLVVDDNTDAAESLGVLLDMEGHAAHIAHTGAEALQLAQAHALDVVFLDIGLPDMTGYDVAKRLRMLPGMDKTLLVALTGWGTQDDRQRTRDAGFDRHLTKPAELVAVEELLRSAARAKTTA